MSNLNFDASLNLTHYSQAQIPLALIRFYYVAGLKFNPILLLVKFRAVYHFTYVGTLN